MTKEEVLDFYDNNWNDHDSVFNMLSKVLTEYEIEIDRLNKLLKNNNSGANDSKEVTELKKMLLECQDRLDEETHSLKNISTDIK